MDSARLRHGGISPRGGTRCSVVHSQGLRSLLETHRAVAASRGSGSYHYDKPPRPKKPAEARNRRRGGPRQTNLFVERGNFACPFGVEPKKVAYGLGSQITHQGIKSDNTALLPQSRYQSLNVTMRPKVLPVPQMPRRRHASCTIWLWSINKFAAAP